MPTTPALPNDDGRLTPERAQAILSLGLPADVKDRMDELAAKARSGQLTADEEIEVENYRQVGCLIDLLKSKARHFHQGNGQ